MKVDVWYYCGGLTSKPSLSTLEGISSLGAVLPLVVALMAKEIAEADADHTKNEVKFYLELRISGRENQTR